MHKQGDGHLVRNGELLGVVWDIKRQLEDVRDKLVSVGNKIARLLELITVQVTPHLPKKVFNKCVFLCDAIEVNMAEPINKAGLAQRSSSDEDSSAAGTPLATAHTGIM